jgi:hypothetical protein
MLRRGAWKLRSLKLRPCGGAGWSHEMCNITQAECVRIHEGSTCSIAMRDGVAPSASKAGSRTAAIRVTFWDALAIAVTAEIGAVFGTQI